MKHLFRRNRATPLASGLPTGDPLLEEPVGLDAQDREDLMTAYLRHLETQQAVQETARDAGAAAFLAAFTEQTRDEGRAILTNILLRRPGRDAFAAPRQGRAAE